MRVGQSIESGAVDGLGLPVYSSRHPTASHAWGNLCDWEIPFKDIYLEGIATGDATFETEAPEWDDWNAAARLWELEPGLEYPQVWR